MTNNQLISTKQIPLNFLSSRDYTKKTFFNRRKVVAEIDLVFQFFYNIFALQIKFSGTETKLTSSFDVFHKRKTNFV